MLFYSFNSVNRVRSLNNFIDTHELIVHDCSLNSLAFILRVSIITWDASGLFAMFNSIARRLFDLSDDLFLCSIDSFIAILNFIANHLIFFWNMNDDISVLWLLLLRLLNWLIAFGVFRSSFSFIFLNILGMLNSRFNLYASLIFSFHLLYFISEFMNLLNNFCVWDVAFRFIFDLNHSLNFSMVCDQLRLFDLSDNIMIFRLDFVFLDRNESSFDLTPIDFGILHNFIWLIVVNNFLFNTMDIIGNCYPFLYWSFDNYDFWLTRAMNCFFDDACLLVKSDVGWQLFRWRVSFFLVGENYWYAIHRGSEPILSRWTLSRCSIWARMPGMSVWLLCLVLH